MRLITAISAAAILIIGFSVAQVTGQRWLGGIILLLGGLWCAYEWFKLAGVVPMIVAGLVFIAAFIASHPLAKLIGAWQSVAVVSVVTAVVGYAVSKPRYRA